MESFRRVCHLRIGRQPDERGGGQLPLQKQTTPSSSTSMGGRHTDAPLRQGLPSQRVENQMCLAIWRATHKLRTLRHLAYSQEGVPEMLPRTQRTAHAVLFGVVFIIEFRQLLILKPAMHSNLAQCGALRSWQLAQFDLTGLGATPRVM